jgi:hypothetical protein
MKMRVLVADGVTIAGRAVGLFGIEECEIDRQDTVIAAQILRLGDSAACFRPPAGIARRVWLACQACRRKAGRKQTYAGGQSLRETILLSIARQAARARTKNRHLRPRNPWLCIEFKKRLTR